MLAKLYHLVHLNLHPRNCGMVNTGNKSKVNSIDVFSEVIAPKVITHLIASDLGVSD
jgi:hypothetical protein